MARLACALTALAALSLFGCAHASVATTIQSHNRLESIPNARVFVMQAIGRQWPAVEDGRTVQKVQGFPESAGRVITDLTLETVRQRHPDAELVDTPFLGRAMMTALDRGATHLVVPIVMDWRDGETQYSGVRDRVEIELQLLQLRPRATVASVTFAKTGSFLAVRDDPPTRLIGDSFRAAVRQLLGER
jgi:hypothetical protein